VFGFLLHWICSWSTDQYSTYLGVWEFQKLLVQINWSFTVSGVLQFQSFQAKKLQDYDHYPSTVVQGLWNMQML
jgi:hypothetical protein